MNPDRGQDSGVPGKRRRWSRWLAAIAVSWCVLEAILQIAHLVTSATGSRAGITDPEAPVVLCLGDSHTYGVFVEPREAYPARLEQALRATGAPHNVVNLGVPGMNTSQIRRRLPELLATYQPAAVIVLASVNGGWNRADAAWSDAEDGLQVPLTTRLCNFFLTEIRTIHGIQVLLHGFEWVGTPDEHATDRLGRVTVHQRDERWGDRPVEPDAFRIVRDLIAIAGLVKGAGATPVLMTYAVPSDRFLNTPNRLLRQSAADLQVELADNDRAIRPLLLGSDGSLDEARKQLFFFADLHLTAKGYEQVAHNALQSLRRAGVLPVPAPDEANGASGEPRGTPSALRKLIASPSNELEPFTPSVTVFDACFPGECRNVPMIRVTTPWGAERFVPIEIPEYVWGHTPSADAGSRASPLFYGRSLDRAKQHGWKLRFAPEQPAAWRPVTGGGVALDARLQGGYVVRFRVLPDDRHFTVHFGFTNGGGEALHDVWAQLCAKGWGSEKLSPKHPTSSWMLGRDHLISWDAAGQDLSWIDGERVPGTDQFARSCYFTADVTDAAVTGMRLPPNGMKLGIGLDLPAIAKATDRRGDGLIVYSPSGTIVEYNALEPCFHADPRLGTVKPGETRWSTTHFVFFRGDLERFMLRLSEIHQSLRRPNAN